ncbi:MAG: PAS domain-containing protein, partial [Candidatus Terrybacteria bacterium]|nr:PAS domain-containing protein [Candidatus Terrybacteria bacterium]
VLRWRKPQYIEAGALAAGVILIGSHVFMVPFDQTRDFFLPRACMPMLAWTALRFGRRETAILTAIFSGIALWGTLHGLGPFAVKDQNVSLLLLQTFMGLIGITAMGMAVVTFQWRRSQFYLQKLNGRLELEVRSRTEALRASEARLMQAQEVAQIGSWEWDIPGNRITWSRELYRVHGLTPEQFNPTYEGFLDLQHPDDRSQVKAVVEAAYRTGDPFSFFHRIIRPDGTARMLHGRGRVIKNEDGRPVRMAGVCQDVTEIKKLEHAFKESEGAITMSRRLLQDEEAERKRIAQDLHDSVNQLLVSLKFCLESLARRLPKGDDDTGALAREARSMLETTIGEVRRICRNLRPAVLDDLGFLAAMRSTCQDLGKRTGLRIKINASDFSSQLAPEIETTLFRIIQEALNNAVQHSGAQEVSVALSCSDSRVKAVVADDGRGFSLDAVSPAEGGCGSGLSNMRERAALAGGEVSIAATPGPGARVEIDLPVTLPVTKEIVPSR